MRSLDRPRKAISVSRVRRHDRRARIDLANQAIHGFEAGVRNLWASLRRPPQSRYDSADDDWPMPIELGSLGGPIPDIRSELMDSSPPRPRRRRVEPAPGPAVGAEPQVPRPEPAALRPAPVAPRPDPPAVRVERQALRPKPQASRE